LTGFLSGYRPSEEAESFLRELLAHGPVPAKQVKADADDTGLSWTTVRRAKERLGIKPHKAGMDAGWLWSLPKVLNQGEDAPVDNVITFAPDEHLRQVLRTAEPQVVEVPDLPAFLDRRRPQ
jgi:putative DNA primase/helicase